MNGVWSWHQLCDHLATLTGTYLEIIYAACIMFCIQRFASEFSVHYRIAAVMSYCVGFRGGLLEISSYPVDPSSPQVFSVMVQKRNEQ